MTTFTLQDLTPAQQEAVKQHEAMHAAYQVVNTRSISNLPTTPEEDEAMQALSERCLSVIYLFYKLELYIFG